MGPSSPKANRRERVVWVRRTLAFVEHLLYARLVYGFFSLLTFRVQSVNLAFMLQKNPLISTLMRRKKTEAKTDKFPKVTWLGSGRDRSQI